VQGSNGATLYDYEYELDSTRGKKRIFNTVTITGEAAAACLKQWHGGGQGGEKGGREEGRGLYTS
jgi:hypothetical protein